MRRRSLLRQSAVIVALGLAGCTGDGDGNTQTASAAPDTRSTTPTGGETTPSPSATHSETPTASPTDVGTETASPTHTASPTPTATPTPAPEQSVTVGPAGQLSFEPASFEIAAGDTVLWTWDSGGHNVKPSATPDGAEWTGTPGGESETFGSGYTYAYTFEVAGTYEYYCAPHRSAGMTGSFTVG